MFFSELHTVRLTPEMCDHVRKIIKEDRINKTNRFGSFSHFLRCAIIEKVKKETN